MGRVRLSVPRAAVPFVIAPVLPKFRERHPRVEVEVCLEDRLVNIVEEGFDAGVRLSESIERDMVHVSSPTPSDSWWSGRRVTWRATARPSARRISSATNASPFARGPPARCTPGSLSVAPHPALWPSAPVRRGRQSIRRSSPEVSRQHPSDAAVRSGFRHPERWYRDVGLDSQAGSTSSRTGRPMILGRARYRQAVVARRFYRLSHEPGSSRWWATAKMMTSLAVNLYAIV